MTIFFFLTRSIRILKGDQFCNIGSQHILLDPPLKKKKKKHIPLDGPRSVQHIIVSKLMIWTKMGKCHFCAKYTAFCVFFQTN